MTDHNYDEDAVSDDPAIVFDELAADAASDAHLVAARQAEIARLEALGEQDEADYIASLIGDKKQKRTADKPGKAGRTQRAGK